MKSTIITTKNSLDSSTEIAIEIKKNHETWKLKPTGAVQSEENKEKIMKKDEHGLRDLVGHD